MNIKNQQEKKNKKGDKENCKKLLLKRKDVFKE